VHEAGHVAAAIEYNISVISTTIDNPDTLRSIRSIERYCVVMLAGREAERLYFAEPLPEGSDYVDLQLVQEALKRDPRAYIELRDGRFKSAQKMIPERTIQLQKRARRLVHIPMMHYRIEVLRAALIKRGTLTGSEIRKVLEIQF
jgi:hypothetical protein